MSKRVIIIAGPNGAGKTTFAREFLPNEASCPIFINADLIAAGLAPFAPETAAVRAGKLMLEEISRRVVAGESFAIETTLAGRNYMRSIQQWQAAGYRVKLIFLMLKSADEAVACCRTGSTRRARHPGIDDPSTIRCRNAELSRRLSRTG